MQSHQMLDIIVSICQVGQIAGEGDSLRRTRVLFMKFELLKRGCKKLLLQAPAVVTDVS